MPLKIKHVHVKSPDPHKSAAWWVENLGARIVWEKSNPTRIKLDFSGIMFIISGIYEKQTRDQHLGLEHIDVDTSVIEFDNVADKLKRNGALLLSDHTKPSKKLIFIETPEGVQIGLSAVVQETRAK
jgi:hypothetical protein